MAVTNTVTPTEAPTKAPTTTPEPTVTPLIEERPYDENYYYDCVIGENAIKIISGDYSRTEVTLEDLPCPDYAIDWKDANLEAAMRIITGVKDRDICLSDVYDITDLNLSNTDISGLSGMSRLTYVYLDNNQITTVEKLCDLPELKEISLENNQVAEIFLKNLPKLKALYLKNNCLTDVSSLAGLRNMYRVDLSGNPVENIEVLQYVDGVEFDLN